MPRKAERPLTAFGKRLKEACDDVGLTPTRLTSILKMPVGYISELQRKEGQTISTYPRWAFQMVAILGVRWEWLFYGEEPKHPPSGPSTPMAAGAVIALTEDAAKHPKKQANYVGIEQATKELAAKGFTSSSAWDWAEAIRLRRASVEGMQGEEQFHARIARKLEREKPAAQKRIRVTAEKRRKQLAKDEAVEAPPPDSVKSQRMKRTKTR